MTTSSAASRRGALIERFTAVTRPVLVPLNAWWTAAELRYASELRDG